jgi:pyruvate,orthophosphate dikinase
MPRPSSTGDDLRRLLDRIRGGDLDAKRALDDFDPGLIRELLLPAIKDAGGQAQGSAQGSARWTGGICGSPGAVAGRACFSAAALLDAAKQGRHNSERPVLVLPAILAGDVPALKAAGGALSSAGGYGSHASVVARQYGKVSLVAPELRIEGNTARLGDLRFCEGDFITLDARPEGSTVCLGAVELAAPEPGPELGEFIALAKGFIKGFQIRANADTPEEAELALSLGAEGIGLCRTEHMFFQEGRINSLRALLLAESAPERERALTTLLPLQREDFYRIFKIMAGKPVTIRLLDAPLHEFMPRNDPEIRDYLEYYSRSTGKLCSRESIHERIALLREENPMLGFRGCRVAVSHPEIYAMQVRAIFEAALQLQEEGIAVQPEILIPLVMNAAELRLIAYGKQAEGASYPGLAEGFSNKTGLTPPPHSIGAMVELPSAALDAGDIARYARFLSFGTNDMTQTTLGLSRDDSAAVLNGYSHYDRLGADPFSVLSHPVKELIALALSRGRLTRPDLVCGLCGEQAADLETIGFCMDAGLDYVSCSPLEIPPAIVKAAQAAMRPASFFPEALP